MESLCVPGVLGALAVLSQRARAYLNESFAARMAPRAAPSSASAGIPRVARISAERVRNIVRHFEAERESTRAWRKILEQTTGTLLRQSGGSGT